MSNNGNYGLTNRNQEMLRVLLDINRGLNTIERSTTNTDRKVNQIHTILMSQVSAPGTEVTTNHVVMPRRSERLKAKKSSPKKKSKSPETKSSFPFFM